MTIDLNKILTISAEAWCDLHGKSLTDYEARGVHIEEVRRPYDLTSLESFAIKVPAKAEVVVAFQQAYGGMPIRRYHASGTALIPKVPGDSCREEGEKDTL